MQQTPELAQQTAQLPQQTPQLPQQSQNPHPKQTKKPPIQAAFQIIQTN
ncbi:hypothetical protein [Viridibacillus arvi]|nr:hypothetical protein [Viridibacillus sp. JNUCC-6]QOV10481.1 hypothetical protein JNUCC6_18145 [Viridibacillus sp. JNUCC-6]